MNLRAFNKAAGRYIPQGSVETQHPKGLGVVYAYEFGAKFGVIAYRGKANKPAFHYTYRTAELRHKQIESFFADLTRHEDYKLKIRDERKQPKPARVKDPNCQHARIGIINDVPVCLDCEGPEHIDLVSTAKIIREELAKAFPSTTFSVRSKSYSGGCSIDVSYTDGPPSQAVDAIAKQFQGASFDGMQDLKTYHPSIWQGRAVKWGPDYVFVHRDTGNAHEQVETMLKARIHYDEQNGHYLPRENAYRILATWDARWETLDRAIERYMNENVAGYAN